LALVPSPSSTNGQPLSASPFQLIMDAPDDQAFIQSSRPGGPHPSSFSLVIAMPRKRSSCIGRPRRSTGAAAALFFSGLAPRSATGRGRYDADDETVEFAQIERLVQIAECSLDQRVGLLAALPVSAHHDDRRIRAKVVDALQQVDTLSPEQGVAYSRHDDIEQNEIEALTLQDEERFGDRRRRRPS
jgi:hypothetical protein